MSLNESSLQIQRRLEGAQRYNRWIYEAIREDLGRRILDIGCSIGNITKLFLEANPDLVIGVDLDPRAVAELNRVMGPSSRLQAVCMDVTRDDLDTFARQGIDTITCLNVLEHIEDDVGLLEMFSRLLGKEGRVVLLVPAFPWLYGTMDATDHHFRRYLRRELESKVSSAGFAVRRSGYMNMLGILGWYVNGRVLRRKIIPSTQLGMFDRLVR